MVSGWWGKGAPSTIKSVYPKDFGHYIHTSIGIIRRKNFIYFLIELHGIFLKVH